MLVMPIVAGLNVKVFVPAFHTHVFSAIGFAPIFKLIALVAQFDVAFVVKPPIFTVICAFGVKAVVQVRVTAELVPEPRIDGEAVGLVAATAGWPAASRVAKVAATAEPTMKVRKTRLARSSMRGT